jgi:hypothetical protein
MSSGSSLIVEVENGLHDHGRVRVAAPRTDLVGGHGAVVSVDLGELESAALPRDRVFGEVHVQDHLTRLA